MILIYVLLMIALILMMWAYVISFNFLNFPFYTLYKDYQQSLILNIRNYSLANYYYKIYNIDWLWYNDKAGDGDNIDDNLNDDNMYCQKNFGWWTWKDNDCKFLWEQGFLPPSQWLHLGYFPNIHASGLEFKFTGEFFNGVIWEVRVIGRSPATFRFPLSYARSFWKHSFNWENISISLYSLSETWWISFEVWLSWEDGLRYLSYEWSWKNKIAKRFNVFVGYRPLMFSDLAMESEIYEQITNPTNFEILSGDFDNTDIGDECSASGFNDVKFVWTRFPQWTWSGEVYDPHVDYINEIIFSLNAYNSTAWLLFSQTWYLSTYCQPANLSQTYFNCSGLMLDLKSGGYLFHVSAYRKTLSGQKQVNSLVGSNVLTWIINYCP